MNIAVTGLACRFPGAADADAFWRHLVACRSGITEVPPTRWDWRAYWGDPATEPNKSLSKWGGFIDDADAFDHGFFGLLPKVVQTMDPQQRLMLELAWHCLEDAGVAPSRLRGRRVGVVVGVFNHDYKELQERSDTTIEAHHATGTAASVIANRVSHFLDLRGPSIPIDTACSSSLNALHSAIQAIEGGDCEMALAGGINLLLTPTRHISFSKMGMLSPTGRCQTLDDGADGYVRGEGAAMLLLKPLDRALADGDAIHGVIRGSAVNHCGQTYTLTYPSVQAQAEVIVAAHERAGVPVGSVGYVEMHGTGTPKGDPIEFEGLTQAFATLAQRQGVTLPEGGCGLASVKTNIGHLEAAAGMAGVVKVLLAFRHRVLPGLHGFTRLNRRIAIEGTPFRVVASNQAWQPADPATPLRAGVSSFGFGGTNAHVLLEAPPSTAAGATAPGPQPIVVSAKTPDALREALRRLAQWLRDDAGRTPLADVAATLLRGRNPFPLRFVCVADSAAALAAQLLQAADGPLPAAVTTEQAAQAQAALQAQGERVFDTPEAMQALLALVAAGADAADARVPSLDGARRSRLPGYPFARDRHWISAPAAARAEGGAAPSQPPLHPLLHHNVSTLGAQRFASRFDGREFFLADHHVDGRAVLPAVAYLEMVRAAVVQALGAAADAAVAFSDVVWLRPLEQRDGPVSARVELDALADGVAFRVRAGDGDDGPLHCSGQARLAAAPLPAVDLAALAPDAGATTLDAAACYDGLAARGLHYGPAHRRLRTLRHDGQRAVADIDPPLADADAYVLHPGTADAALQAAVALVTGLGREGADAPAGVLPFSAEQVVIGPAARGALRAVLRPAAGDARRAAGRVDIDVFPADAPATPVLQLRGLWLRGAQSLPLSAAAEPAEAAPAAVAPPAALAGSLYVPRWTVQPLASEPGAAVAELLLVGDAPALARFEPLLRAAPAFAHSRVSSLCWGQGGIDPAGLEAHAAVVAALPALPTHVLSLASAAPGADTLPAALPGLFSLARTLMRPAVKQLRLVHLVAGDAQPEDLALGGFFKTLRIEKPAHAGRVLVFDDLAPEALPWQAVHDELVAADRETEVRHAAGRRLVRRFVAAGAVPDADTPALSPAVLRDGGTYLVTGGLGALGRLFARHLCRRHHARVVLTGRSAAGAAADALVAELKALGGDAMVVACDVSQRADVDRLLQTVHAAGHRLNGVVHAAGVIEDAFILRKTPEAFARVLAPKLLGTRHLDAATAGEPLDFFATFSSVAGVLGNVGQCDYASGNAFEDAFVHQRQIDAAAGRRSGRALSVNWPYWLDGGMRLGEQEEAMLRRNFGIVPLPTDDGLAAFEYGLRQPAAQLVVMPGDAQRVAQVLGVVETPAAEVVQTSDAAPAAGPELKVRVARHLAGVFAAHLGIADDFDVDRPLREYGFDSVVTLELVDRLEKTFGSLPKTLFFEYQTLGELASYLIDGHAEACRALGGGAVPAAAPGAPVPAAAADAVVQAPQPFTPVTALPPAAPSRADDPIAIVGLAGRYPQADTLQQFWANLQAGLDCIVEVPADRWDYRKTFQPGAPAQGKTYSKWGGFMDGVDRFDASFFNISPKEAEFLDPNERLFLETAAHAIEDAGYAPDRIAAPRGQRDNPVGVYVGLMWGDYQLHGVDGPPHTWFTPHSCYWAVANRVSHFFNFSGPSITIDTACSSSLSAIHLACAAIRSGEIDAAIAGGVNLALHPNKYNMLADLHFLSTNGRCMSFGEGGDGYVPGEGVGAVLLKPLSRALADGDHVYGVIRGSAVNHGGKTSGFTVPNPKRQAALVSEAIESAGLQPEEISYVEAHGTGTSLGDPIEIAGLARAFATVPRQSCAIGSVKSNIGHLEAAAGVAALTKVLLQMRHGTLVPSIHSTRLNPYIDFAASPFTVQRTLGPWARPQRGDEGAGAVELPRIAGISSFGAGSSNAHLIVEEFIDPRPARHPAADAAPGLIVLSARRAAVLREVAGRLAAHWAAASALRLDDVAYTLQVGRVGHEHRLAFVAADAPSAIAALQAYAAGGMLPAGAASGHRDDFKRGLAPAELGAGVAGWLDAGTLAPLAEAWVHGAPVDWARLHAGAGRRRVSLPGYPYEPQRHWVTKPQGWPTHAALHALLDANVSTLEAQAFRKTLRADEFFLRDHRLGTQRVLPAVASLEMVLQAVQRSTRERSVVALHDVAWLAPVQVDDDGELGVELLLTPEPRGLRFELHREGTDAARRALVSGVVELAPAAAPTPPFARIDLPALRGRCTAVHAKAEADAAFDRMGLKLGATFQVIDTLHAGAHEACGTLRLPAAAAGGDWLLHPSLLDGALRTALSVGGLDAEAGLRVPVHLQSLQLRRPVAADCVAVATAADAPRGDRQRFDIAVTDGDGEPLALLRGLSIQAVPHLARPRPAGPAPSARPVAPAAPAVAAASRPQPATATAAPAGAALHAAAVRHLKELLAGVTRLPIDQIDAHGALENYGIDSMMIMKLTEQLQAHYGEVSKTLFFEYQDLNGVAGHLVEHHAERIGGAGAAVAAPAAAPVGTPVATPVVAPLPAAALHEAAVRHLTAVLADVTKLPADQIDAHGALENYGIDSVMIMKLTEQLQAHYGEVPKTLFFEYQDLAGVAGYLVEHHAARIAGAVPAEAAAVAAPAAEPPAGPAALHDAVVQHLKRLLAEVTRLPLDQIDAKAPLENYGIDSVMILGLNERLQAAFDEVPKTLFFEYQDLDGVAGHFVEAAPAKARALLGRSAAAPVAAPVGVLPVAAPAAAAPSPADADAAAREATLLSCLHDAAGEAGQGCGASTPLADWPLDTVAQWKLLQRLDRHFADVAPNALYRHETLAQWAAALQWREPRATGGKPVAALSAPAAPAAMRFGALAAPAPSAAPTRAAAPASGDIAIIGIAGRYPGADDVEGFWRQLAAGTDGIREIPVERWDCRPHFNPDRSAKGESYAKWGGFLDGIDGFDARFFNISAREAELIDPQERLFLQTAWQCMEDACYPRPALKGRSVGVYVGVMWGHYALMGLADPARKEGWPSACFSSIANRVSYVLNLHGPSMALDTMCSSSLTAIHLACQAMRNGDCDMAIAGGVNLIVHPNKYRVLAQGQFLSSDGRCRAFGAGGDGYVPGEGVGAVLLKPLEQAVADGDRILGVVKATAVNHGGKTNGYTVPNQVAQSSVIGSALRRAGWHPGAVDYIEAHGTGTSLGDPIEIAGLGKAFASVAAEHGGADALPAAACRIGSVKSNIGHLESAAGIAGLTKVLMQMRHRRFAPSLHALPLNPNIDFARAPFRVVQTLEDWLPAQPGAPRRAGISSFGAGGSNAHLLIEEHLAPAEAAADDGQPRLFVLSADGEERLGLYVDRVLDFLAQQADAAVPVSLAALAWSSQIGREPMAERLAVVATSLAELADALARWRRGEPAPAVCRGSLRRAGERLDAVMDAAEQAALAQSLAQPGRLPQLAKAWVTLMDVDWAAAAATLYGGRPPRRAAFPTLPFLTQRYWVEPGLAARAAAGGLHPLLDDNVSTLQRQAYRKTFADDAFYLRDHIVEAGSKRMILPGAAYLEMARAAGGLAAGPGFTVRGVQQLMWMQPIELAGAPQAAELRLQPDGDGLRFEVVRADGETCVDGRLLLAPADEAPADEVLNLDALRAQSLHEDRLEAIYADFAAFGFHYGPAFRVTRQRHRLSGAALARLELPEALRADAGRWGLHPSLLDGVLRTCLGIEPDALRPGTGPIVPFALQSLEFRHPLGERCWAYAVPSADDDSHGALRKNDIVVTDDDGRVLVKLHGFAARRLTPAGEGASTAADGALQCFRPAWLPRAVEPAAAWAAASTVLVAGTDADALAQALGAHAGPARAVAAPVGFEPGREADWTALLAQADADGAPASHVVLAWPAGDDSDAALRALRALFCAHERRTPGQALRCVLATPCGDGDECPAQDAAAGLGRSLLTLNHRFELLTLRHDAAEAATLADRVAAELAATGRVGGREIAHMAGTRRQRLLERHDAAPRNALPLREQGVYLVTGGAGQLGRLLARHLAEGWRARLLLSGRSAAPTAAQQADIDTMRALGAEVHYQRADTAVEADVRALVAEAKQRWGVLNGVFHCAGVAAERTVLELDEAGFAALWAGKAEGARLLDLATADEPLDCFVSYGSVSAVLGDPGCGAYAAANRFLDSHAARREALRRAGRRQGVSVSIGWPLWADGGMPIQGDHASVFGVAGLQPLTPAQGLAALEVALAAGEPQLVVAHGEPARIARSLRVADGSAAAAPAAPVARPALPLQRSAPVATAAVPVPVPVRMAAAPAAAAGAPHAAGVEALLARHIAKIVKTDASEIDAQRSFEQCGMDSVMLMELHASLAAEIPGLPKTALFEHDSPARLAQHLLRQHGDAVAKAYGVTAEPAPAPRPAIVAPAEPAARPLPTLPPSRLTAVPAPTPARPTAPAPDDDPVAIVGLAGEFPQAEDLAAFWQNVVEGRDCLSEIPPERWTAAELRPGTGRRDPRRGQCSRGGFLRDAYRFDPAPFRMTPAEAEAADPQLRVMLRTAWRALEDAATTPAALADRTVGVFVGAMNEDHTWIMAELGERQGRYFGAGSVASEFANRISYLMDFRGPSLTVSTACASSLTAVHLARQAILRGECEVALAGGVNLSLHPSKYQMLDGMKVLSPDGVERTFDERANGLVPAEGAGIVVLKRLSQALADGDTVHGVLRGSALGHSGTGAGLYVPNLRVIEETAARAIAESGLAPDALGLIESHGAGTELGDPIELKALANALRRGSDGLGFCAIGTKANLGHMEAASGVCALIKVLLAMRDGRLAPCAGLQQLNASFDAATLPFRFPTVAEPWPVNAQGRRAAGVHSFGMGGSNVFLVVESPPPQPVAAAAEGPALVVLSAGSTAALNGYLAALCRHLRDTPAAVLHDIAYASQVGRVVREHRLAIVAHDADELLRKAERWLARGSAAGVHTGQGSAERTLAELLAGASGAAFVDALVQAGEFDKLASLWARGCAVDWSRLHADGRRHVSFPGMPFDDADFDIRRRAVAASAAAEAPVAPAATQSAPAVASAPAPEPAADAGCRCDAPAAALGEGPPAVPSEVRAQRPALAEPPPLPQAWYAPADGEADERSAPPAIDPDALERDGDTVRQYWLDQLRDLADTSFVLAPSLLPGTGGLDAAAMPDELQSVALRIDGERAAALQRCTQRHRIEVSTLVIAAWALLINRYTKARCAQFGVLRSFEPATAEGPDTPACHLVPVRVCTVQRGRIADWLPTLQHALDRKRAFAATPIQHIEGWTGMETLFDSALVFAPAAGLAADDAARATLGLATSADGAQTRVAIELHVAVERDALMLNMACKSGRRMRDAMRAVLAHLQVLLQGLGEHPDRNPVALAMRTAAESRERMWKSLDGAQR